MNNDQVLTVGALTSYIEQKFVKDPYLERVFVKGELSNNKIHSSGHFYFSLKDHTGLIRGIMFKNNKERMKTLPKEGDQVIIEGRITLFKAGGYYSLQAENIQLDGLGQLFETLEKNKRMLDSKGYFRDDYKKTLPFFPKKIVLITSTTSAAVKDMLHAISKRYPLVQVELMNTLMQGQNSIKSVINNLERADNREADIIILARGGGSIEDLWTFNELDVALKVFDTNTPVITGIGHETDTTLVDYVSDLRATTPTQAVEIALPDYRKIDEELLESKLFLKKKVHDIIGKKQINLDAFKNYYKFRMPTRLYDQQIQKLDYVKEKLNNIFNTKIKSNKYQYSKLTERLYYRSPKETIKNKQDILAQNEKQLLISVNRYHKQLKNDLYNKIEIIESLSPLKILKRGFSYTTINNSIIKSANNIEKGDIINTKLKKGELKSEVIEVNLND